MIRTLASLLGDWQRAVTVVLGVGAAAGWGMLAVSSQSAAETERQLQEWVATLQDSQKQLLLERDQIPSCIRGSCSVARPAQFRPG